MTTKLAVALMLAVALTGVVGAACPVGGQTANITLTVHIRDVVGNPVSGIGVHLYWADFDAVTLVGDQVTDATGAAQFSVVPHGSYSVALYAPEGSSRQLLPEDQQYLPGMGDLSIGGVIGIGLVMGEKDYTMRLVLQENRPYHDRSPNDQEIPEPYIPGVTDRDWATPTPYALVVSTVGPTAGPTSGPTVGSSQPTGSATAAVPLSGSFIQPAPFPWGPVLVLAGLFGAGWVGYQLYSRGQLQRWRQQWRSKRRSRKSNLPKSGG